MFRFPAVSFAILLAGTFFSSLNAAPCPNAVLCLQNLVASARPTHPSWSRANPCLWTGIECTANVVIAIRFNNTFLTSMAPFTDASIPDTVTLLSIRNLGLTFVDLANLPGLTKLDFTGNALVGLTVDARRRFPSTTGAISRLSRIPQLEYIIIDDNLLLVEFAAAGVGRLKTLSAVNTLLRGQFIVRCSRAPACAHDSNCTNPVVEDATALETLILTGTIIVGALIDDCPFFTTLNINKTLVAGNLIASYQPLPVQPAGLYSVSISACPRFNAIDATGCRFTGVAMWVPQLTSVAISGGNMSAGIVVTSDPTGVTPFTNPNQPAMVGFRCFSSARLRELHVPSNRFTCVYVEGPSLLSVSISNNSLSGAMSPDAPYPATLMVSQPINGSSSQSVPQRIVCSSGHRLSIPSAGWLDISRNPLTSLLVALGYLTYLNVSRCMLSDIALCFPKVEILDFSFNRLVGSVGENRGLIPTLPIGAPVTVVDESACLNGVVAKFDRNVEGGIILRCNGEKAADMPGSGYCDRNTLPPVPALDGCNLQRYHYDPEGPLETANVFMNAQLKIEQSRDLLTVALINVLTCDRCLVFFPPPEANFSFTTYSETSQLLPYLRPDGDLTYQFDFNGGPDRWWVVKSDYGIATSLNTRSCTMEFSVEVDLRTLSSARPSTFVNVTRLDALNIQVVVDLRPATVGPVSRGGTTSFNGVMTQYRAVYLINQLPSEPTTNVTGLVIRCSFTMAIDQATLILCQNYVRDSPWVFTNATVGLQEPPNFISGCSVMTLVAFNAQAFQCTARSFDVSFNGRATIRFCGRMSVSSAETFCSDYSYQGAYSAPAQVAGKVVQGAVGADIPVSGAQPNLKPETYGQVILSSASVATQKTLFVYGHRDATAVVSFVRLRNSNNETRDVMARPDFYGFSIGRQTSDPLANQVEIRFYPVQPSDIAFYSGGAITVEMGFGPAAVARGSSRRVTLAAVALTNSITVSSPLKVDYPLLLAERTTTPPQNVSGPALNTTSTPQATNGTNATATNTTASLASATSTAPMTTLDQQTTTTVPPTTLIESTQVSRPLAPKSTAASSTVVWAFVCAAWLAVAL
jgi:Leucine-rich repeat (LRR) protein